MVQLFNAVRNQQKTFEKELNKDVPESKKEKILKKFDKRTFLDTLMGQSKSIVVEEQTKTLKDEKVKSEEKPKWNVLRYLLYLNFTYITKNYSFCEQT